MTRPAEPPAPNTRMIFGHSVEVRPGRRLSLTVHEGREHGDVAVFLCHGAGGNKNQWRNQWRMLCHHGYRVIAWDLPGHGETRGARQAQAYAGEELVQDYLALIETHGARRNVLIGHSYGARLTLCLLARLKAEDRLALVDRVVLLGAPPATPPPNPGPIAAWPLPLLVLLRPLLAREFNRLAWHPSADPALVRYEDRLTRRNSLFMMKALMTQAAPLDPADLAELHLPVLLVTGAGDGQTPAAGAEALARFLPQARLHVLEACGHQIMLEKPAETNALLKGFLGG
jgi:pimeloyl-ACP methyl ester carboxylesterase